MGATLALATSALAIGLGVATAPPAMAGSTSCGAAVCMFEHKNYDGLVLRGAWFVCGWYQNLKNEGFNDKMSSIANWAKYSQLFYTNADYKGSKYTLGAYGKVSNLVTPGFNDKISSVVWTG